ncbi:uncharacterized protein LOC119070828 [Bradysia coprophila]|uniref:uncharacterized protein LOC119070828 n=1 Tax=Bradysia coprophila TaxID=38358 RepID=UPI00187D8236|nr:uncharacterized protein LOC119070828 [Bradysia coprophila]
MLPSRTGNRQRKKIGKKSKQLYKPKIEYTDDGIVVTTLYIKSLGKEITRSHLVDYFTKYGKIQNVRIHGIPTKANGFGFVTFARPEAASKVLQSRFHKINGKEVTIAIADSWHQEKPLEQSNNHKTKPVKLPIELTNTTGTYLTDLNDDCLYEIFSRTSLNIMDLCSVAETCTRLKAIATRIFTKLHKSCKFNEMSLQTIHEMRRMLINFGSSITDLTIGPSYELEQHYDGIAARVLDLVIRCCSKTLESLRLKDFQISDHLIGKLRPMFAKLKLLHIDDGYIGDGKQLFANCASLIELKVTNWENDENGMIFENKFPKLERFKYKRSHDDYDDYDLETFVSNHKGLKALSMGNFHADCSSLLPVIAKNCTDLEKLNITGHHYDSPYNYVEALKSLLTLKKLTKLKIKCDKENVTKFLKELPQLSSLEYLELWFAQSDAEFIPALSELKNLKVLRLRDCNHLKNVDALANLDKLTELSILIPSPTAIVDIEIDIVALVKRLTDLKKLTIGLHSITVDRQMFLRLVSVVRERPGRLPSPLEVKAFSIQHQAFDLQLDSKNHEFVTLEPVEHYDSEYDSENDSYMSDEYSDSDFDPYFLDDAESDDFDFPAAFLLPYLQHQIMNHFGGGSDDEDSDDVDADNEDEDTEVW